MGVFSFLQPPKKGAPATQIAALEESLAKLRGEHKSVQAIVESHGQKRAEMLLSDAADVDIVKLDADADLARIRLERLELAELELTDRLERARDKSERERLAGELERDASAIEVAAKELERTFAPVAEAFSNLLKVIPEETQIAKPGSAGMPTMTATKEDIARAIFSNGLFNAEPDIFEQTVCPPHLARMGGAAVSRALHVCTFEGGLLTQRNAGLVGEECAIHPAPVAADKLIINPLRQKATTLRDGVAERLEAAE